MKLPHKMNPVHCSSKDGTRYVLNSVSLQGNLAVATDGRTLFAVKGTRDDDDDPRDALVPKRAARAAWPQTKGKRERKAALRSRHNVNVLAPAGEKTN